MKNVTKAYFEKAKKNVRKCLKLLTLQQFCQVIQTHIEQLHQLTFCHQKYQSSQMTWKIKKRISRSEMMYWVRDSCSFKPEFYSQQPVFESHLGLKTIDIHQALIKWGVENKFQLFYGR